MLQHVAPISCSLTTFFFRLNSSNIPLVDEVWVLQRCSSWYVSSRQTLGIQSYSQMMIGVSNHLLSIVFRFHYHCQKVIGSLGKISGCVEFLHVEWTLTAPHQSNTSSATSTSSRYALTAAPFYSPSARRRTSIASSMARSTTKSNSSSNSSNNNNSNKSNTSNNSNHSNSSNNSKPRANSQQPTADKHSTGEDSLVRSPCSPLKR